MPSGQNQTSIECTLPGDGGFVFTWEVGVVTAVGIDLFKTDAEVCDDLGQFGHRETHWGKEPIRKNV